MKTIQLTVDKTNEKNINYYLSDITEEQYNIILQAKKDNNLRTINNIIGISCENIIKIGETNLAKPYSISSELGFLYGAITDDKPKLNINRPKQYRNYSISVEEQEKTKHLIPDHPDEIFSAKSALKQMKEKYCCLWWDNKEVIYECK